jgi:tetratricopeptide (TPR) repeat protein
MKKSGITLLCMLCVSVSVKAQYQNEDLSKLYFGSQYARVTAACDSILKKDDCALEPLYFRSMAKLKPAGDSSLYPFPAVLQFEKCYRQNAVAKKMMYDDQIMLADTRFMDLFYIIGLRYSKDRDYRRAAEWYNLARVLYRDNAVFHYNIGESYLAIKSYPKAIDFLTKSAALDSSNAQTFYNLSCAYALSNKAPGALSCLEKAIRLNPKYKKIAAGDTDLAIIKTDSKFKLLTGE